MSSQGLGTHPGSVRTPWQGGGQGGCRRPNHLLGIFWAATIQAWQMFTESIHMLRGCFPRPGSVSDARPPSPRTPPHRSTQALSKLQNFNNWNATSIFFAWVLPCKCQVNEWSARGQIIVSVTGKTGSLHQDNIFRTICAVVFFVVVLKQLWRCVLQQSHYSILIPTFATANQFFIGIHWPVSLWFLFDFFACLWFWYFSLLFETTTISWVEKLQAFLRILISFFQTFVSAEGQEMSLFSLTRPAWETVHWSRARCFVLVGTCALPLCSLTSLVSHIYFF